MNFKKMSRNDLENLVDEICKEIKKKEVDFGKVAKKVKKTKLFKDYIKLINSKPTITMSIPVELPEIENPDDVYPGGKPSPHWHNWYQNEQFFNLTVPDIIAAICKTKEYKAHISKIVAAQEALVKLIAEECDSAETDDIVSDVVEALFYK